MKQGCPLSPIIINLSIELILRSIKKAANSDPCGPALHHKVPLSTLAYADDLVLIARQEISLQVLLNAASILANALGLIFRPDKSACLSFTNSKRAPEKFPHGNFKVQNKVIPALTKEHYRYLGVPIGVIHNTDIIRYMNFDLSEDLMKIENSLVAPWQKLDAIRSFIQPCFTFILRAGCSLKKSLTDYRSTLVKTIKNICNLPSRASTSYIFAHKHVGGLAFPDPKIEMDIQTIVQAIKMLSSNDPVVTNIACGELFQTVHHASQSNPTPALTSNYLSSLPDDLLKNIRYHTQSLWTRTRKSTNNLGILFNIHDSSPPTISSQDSNSVPSTKACRFLHYQTQMSYAHDLLELPDQGKVACCLSTDLYANGSTWQFNGLNTHFKDWRFIRRARQTVFL